MLKFVWFHSDLNLKSFSGSSKKHLLKNNAIMIDSIRTDQSINKLSTTLLAVSKELCSGVKWNHVVDVERRMPFLSILNKYNKW